MAMKNVINGSTFVKHRHGDESQMKGGVQSRAFNRNGQPPEIVGEQKEDREMNEGDTRNN